MPAVELGYDSRGRVTQKKTTLVNRPNDPLYIDYQYDNLSRLTDVQYPHQYGAGSARKLIHNAFDAAGRLSSLQVDAANYASEFEFNNFGQVSSMKVGPSGANQITETYDYAPETGLLENQKVLRASTALLDLSYEYQQCSCSSGGGGQVTKIIDNLDRNKDRAYEYDALTRLRKVFGGVNRTWAQEYAYDRYGNRTGVTSLGVEALRNQGRAAGDKVDPSLVQARDSGAVLSDIPRVTVFGDATSNSQTAETLNRRMTREEDSTPEPAKSESPNPVVTPNYVPFDFDNDNKADLSVFKRGAGDWQVKQSANGQTTLTHFGAAGDQIVPGDYDGDGKADLAVWRPSTGVWWILRSSDGSHYGVQWGMAGDSVVPDDYDGDGKTDLAVWRPSTTGWFIMLSSNGTTVTTGFGGQNFGDVPVPGDYDGDGKADIAIWRPTTGVWWILQSSNLNLLQATFGISGDVPVQGRYDTDSKDDLAVWRPSTGYWYILKSSNGQVLENPFGGLSFGVRWSTKSGHKSLACSSFQL